MPKTTKPILSLDTACDPGAPGTVRAAMAGLAWLGDRIDDVTLIASELVTNAVLHSGCLPEHMLAVRAYVNDERMTISVHDPGLSPLSADPSTDGDGTNGGWGLRIVERLTARWGSQREDGYRVWAEVALAPS
jgi:anti-sigma regulatory factor (Ser/Thr protein kinase)